MKLIPVFLLLLTFVVSSAQTSTRWRGTNGNGVYPDKGLLDQWPEQGPELLWSYNELGEGHSSVAVANDVLYVSGMKNDSIGSITVLSKEGERLKEFIYGTEFYKSFPGSRSTPTIVGDKLYMMSGLGVLVCMSTEDGTIDWTRELLSEMDGENIRWGVTETVVVDGDMVYCSPGGKVSNVIALNRHNGEQLWSCPGKGDLSAYCTPLLINLPQRKLLVTMMANNILGIDAKTGKLLWSYEQTNQWSVHANTPVYQDGIIACTSGYGKGTVSLKLSEDGSSVEKNWFSKEYDDRMGGAVLIGGYLYGSGDKNRNWMCLDWLTGEQLYESKEIGKGNIIAADNKLYCYSERGELAMAKADTSGFNVLGKTKITMGSAQHWSHPVIDKGVLYLRHGVALMAYKIK